MEPGSIALAQPKVWACCLPSHNTVTTCKGTIKTLGAILSVLYGGFSTAWVSLQSRVLGECRSGSLAQRLDFFFHWPPLFSPDPSLFPSPTPLTVQSPSTSQLKFYRFFWGCSQYPADQQGIFQLQAALETLAVHQPSHHYAYLQQRGFWQNCSLSCKWPVHLGRGYSGHVRVGNCPHVFPLSPPQRHFLASLLCKKAIRESLSLEIQVS